MIIKTGSRYIINLVTHSVGAGDGNGERVTVTEYPAPPKHPAWETSSVSGNDIPIFK